MLWYYQFKITNVQNWICDIIISICDINILNMFCHILYIEDIYFF